LLLKACGKTLLLSNITFYSQPRKSYIAFNFGFMELEACLIVSTINMVNSVSYTFQANQDGHSFFIKRRNDENLLAFARLVDIPLYQCPFLIYIDQHFL
jgi:hypothetical protein